MKLEINILEKIMILNSLPSSGSLKEMRIIRNMNKTFPLSESEKDECGVSINNDNSFQCNSKAMIKHEYEISADELDILKEIVCVWDERREVNEFNLDLCEKINSLNINDE